MPTNEQVAKLKARGERAAKDFMEFCRFVLRIEPAKHELPWIEKLQALADGKLRDAKGRPTKRLIIVAPPGSGKSQIVGVGFLVWMIGRSYKKHHGLLSFSDDPAWERSKTIKWLIENSRAYRFVFPDVKPDKRAWAVKNWRCKRPDLEDLHPTLRAGGVNSAIVSYRMDGLLIDDPMDERNSANARQRQKAFETYEQAVMTRLVDKAWQVCIGTRWADDDFIGRLLKRKNERWCLVHTTAEDEEGKTYWPWDGRFGYSQQFMDELKFKSPALYALQYMGDTTGGETGIIKAVGGYSYLPKSLVDPEHADYKDLLVGAGWDTALKRGQENDFNVGFVGGLSEDGRLWVLDRVRGRWGVNGLARQMEKQHEEWDPYCTWIEDTAAGTPAVDTLMEKASVVPTELVKYSGDKVSRAYSLSAWIHGGHVIFPKYADWFEEVKYFLTHFPYTDFDDDVDALFILVSNLLAQRHPALYAQERPKHRIRMR